MASAGSDDEQRPQKEKWKTDSPHPVADQDQEPKQDQTPPVDQVTREARPEETIPADEETRGPEEPRREESSSPTEKQQPKPPGKPSHVSLPPKYVEMLKGIKNWGDEDKIQWVYDDEKIGRVFEIQQNMDINDLLSYVMHGDGEEVVWHEDVWNSQASTQVPEGNTVPPPREKIAEPAAAADSGGRASS